MMEALCRGIPETKTSKEGRKSHTNLMVPARNKHFASFASHQRLYHEADPAISVSRSIFKQRIPEDGNVFFDRNGKKGAENRETWYTVCQTSTLM